MRDGWQLGRSHQCDCYDLWPHSYLLSLSKCYWFLSENDFGLIWFDSLYGFSLLTRANWVNTNSSPEKCLGSLTDWWGQEIAVLRIFWGTIGQFWCGQDSRCRYSETFLGRKRNRYIHSNREPKIMLAFAHQTLNKKYFMRIKIPWIFATEMQC